MNLKSTPANVAKLEKIFEEAKYILRYEKGTFNSGYCVLEHKKVVVINKFLNIEGRINTLIDIIPAITLEEGFLTPESQKLYRQIVDARVAADADAAEATAVGEETVGGEASAAGGEAGEDAASDEATAGSEDAEEAPAADEANPDSETPDKETPEA